ncbi:(d)CMP kinase [uncultured Parolsenella sp.]|uniref:(d)CMP kinase n=1 Tax=uncultured Parolsenella sp. TaxID=2083008 RepID=UPI0025F0067B|nr:(d)CMP kinase [uncultured Parolsenella sp.]
MIVAIDGPAGSGKSTVARAMAVREHLTYLDTGAMYRSVTDAALTRGLDLDDARAVSELARDLDIVLDNGEQGPVVIVDGQDRTDAIRMPEVDANVSKVAAIPAVREAMVALQRKAAESTSVVAEGRDIGTVVFPAAEVKVFLTADPSARARRRAVQRQGGNTATDANAQANAEEQAKIEAELIERDRMDSTRATAPLKPAEDAVHIDSTELTVDEVCDKICELMERARA